MRSAIKALGAMVLAGALIGPAAAQAAPTHALPLILVTLNGGRSVAVSGQLTSGAAHIQITTIGEKDGELTLVHLRAGVTIQEAQTKVNPNDLNTLNPLGGIKLNADAPRGVTNVQALLPPGQYGALDTSGQGNQRPPQTGFVVAKSTAPAALPPAQAKYNIIDFRFQGPATLRDGEVLRIHNSGWLVHMAAAAQARNRAGAVQLRNLLLAGKDRQAQRVSIGSVAFAGPISHGATQQARVKARPGWYVLACFMDTQDHREHVQLGMLRIIHIVP
jgi:hypothetical protein